MFRCVGIGRSCSIGTDEEEVMLRGMASLVARACWRTDCGTGRGAAGLPGATTAGRPPASVPPGGSGAEVSVDAVCSRAKFEVVSAFVAVSGGVATVSPGALIVDVTPLAAPS